MSDRLSVVAVALLFALWPSVARACSVCFGDEDGGLAAGLNAGIGVLLALVLLVQVAIVRFFWKTSRRARAQRDVDPTAPPEASR